MNAPTLFALACLSFSAPVPQTLQRLAAQDPTSDAQALESWKSRLTERDLDLRESAFREAAARIRMDQALRTTLEDWAKDESNLELAWTARLALGASKDPFAAFGNWPGMQGQFFLEPFGGQRGMFQQQTPFGGFPLTPVPPSTGAPSSGSSSRSKSLQLQSGPDGVTVKIEREEDGQTKTDEYSADSIEELLEAHPELAEDLGRGSAQGQSIPGFGLGMEFPQGLDGSVFGFRPGMQGFQWQPFGQTVPRPGSKDTVHVQRTDVLGVLVRPLESSDASPAKSGLVIERVEPGTIAAALALQRGHLLTKINGRTIESASDISESLAARARGGQIQVEFLDHFGQPRTRTYTPQDHPQSEDEKAQPPAPELRKI